MVGDSRRSGANGKWRWCRPVLLRPTAGLDSPRATSVRGCPHPRRASGDRFALDAVSVDTAFVGLLRLRLRAERRSASRWIGAVLLLALAGGAALTAAQAARRTDTAFSRDLVQGRAADAFVDADAVAETGAQAHHRRETGLRMLDAVDRSALVVAHGRLGGASIYRIRDGKIDQRFNTGSAFGLVAYDTQVFRTVSVPRIASGRLASPARADEVTINPVTARLTGWRVGSSVTDLREYDWGDLEPGTYAPLLDRGSKLRLHVVGIVTVPDELLRAKSERLPRVYFTPAFARQFPETAFYVNDFVRLRHGAADLPALRATAAAANRADPSIDLLISPTGEQLGKVNRANDPLVNGLWILAGLFALVGVLLAAQSLGRSLAARADDHAQLRALGSTRRQRAVLDLATLVAVALAAAALAAILGYAFSPLTPIGSARDAEPNPGLSLNVALSLAAIGTIFVGTMLAALPALWRVVNMKALPGAPTTIDTKQRKSRTADLVAQSSLGTPAVIGTRLALQPGRGASATPVRSVLASLILVVATVTATFAFGVNLQRWTTTPRLYGWNWDAALGSDFGTIPPQFEQGVAHFPHVAEASAMTLGKITVAGRTIPAIGVDRFRGALMPRIDAGRLPKNVREIVLGAKSMRAIHKQIGDTIAATIGTEKTTLQIVGRATFAAFGNERGNESGLGVGALGTVARFPAHDESTPGGRYNYMLLRFTPGTAVRAEQQLRAFLAKNGCADPTCLITDSRPAEIDGYRSARRLPLAIGIVLVLLLVATLTHVLVSTMRRRTRDLAILRALGCTPRNLVATMRWQSLVLTGTSILIGIPLGLLANSVAWGAFSTQLGIAPGTVAPLAELAIGAIALLVLATALSTVVGRRVPGAIRGHRFAA